MMHEQKRRTCKTLYAAFRRMEGEHVKEGESVQLHPLRENLQLKPHIKYNTFPDP